MSILDKIGPNQITIERPDVANSSQFLDELVISPKEYTNAWIFYSQDDDEYVLERLENLSSRLERVLTGKFCINYMAPRLCDYRSEFDSLPSLFSLEEKSDEQRHTRWLLQFNIPRLMPACSIFRLFVSLGDWISELHRTTHNDSILYESNGVIYLNKIATGADFFRECYKIKRGLRQRKTNANELTNKLYLFASCSYNLYRYDYHFHEKFTEIYNHYAETRHNYQEKISPFINVEEVAKSFQKVNLAAQLFSITASNKLGPQIKVLKNALDFRSTFNK